MSRHKSHLLRMKNWVYGSSAYYFITISTKNKAPYFGRYLEKTIELNELALVATNQWNRLYSKFPHIKCDAMVIMPDHLHCIIALVNTDFSSYNTEYNSGTSRYEAKNPILHENISTVVRSLKGATTFEARKINANFQWMSRFYETVIRDEKHLNNVRNYIYCNPYNFNKKKLNALLK